MTIPRYQDLPPYLDDDEIEWEHEDYPADLMLEGGVEQCEGEEP